MRSFILICLVAVFASTWAIKDKTAFQFYLKRYFKSRSVNDPDDPRFSLANLDQVFREMKEQIQGDGSVIPGMNPFGIRPDCDFKSEFRTIDGTCNNVRTPRNGAAKIPLRRLVPNTYEDGKDEVTKTFFRSQGKLPTARIVSRTVMEQTSNLSSDHSHLLMGYGQFLDHDITISPEAGGEGGIVETAEACCELPENEFVGEFSECFPLDVTNDAIFTATDCIPFLRSAPVPPLPGARFERFQLNDLTAYVDGSNVYGSTNIIAFNLRAYEDGLLKSSQGPDGEERLPPALDNPPSCFTMAQECRFFAGDVRSSEQAGLSSMHTLLVREHNRIARELKKLNPQLTNPKTRDEIIYQNTRKIVGAILQRVTFREFIPEVVGPEITRRLRLLPSDTGRENGYQSNLDASVVTEFSTAAFRFGHTLIRQTFGGAGGKQINLLEMFEAVKTIEENGATSILNGLAKDPAQSFERFFAPTIQDELFGMDLDLVALNIQRGRDHGIGSYMRVRQYFNLRTFTKYDDMVGVTHDMETINRLRKVYPSPVDIELFPGGISEFAIKGGVVGELFANIIGIQFKRMKFGDRFWHETNDRTVKFTDDQLAQIRTSSFAQLYCENVPGNHVREFMLRQVSESNPSVDCGKVDRLDLSPWAYLA